MLENNLNPVIKSSRTLIVSCSVIIAFKRVFTLLFCLISCFRSILIFKLIAYYFMFYGSTLVKKLYLFVR